MTLLHLRNVGISYRTATGLVPAVHGVDLSLDAGDTLGLAGESGCGKTTLALSALHLLPRNAVLDGQVLLADTDIRTLTWGQLRAARWAQASVVFQGAMHALNPVQDIGDQIAEPLRLHRPRRSRTAAALRHRVYELLDQVELPTHRARAYPHELSGGQKQRVMIAMALACQPNLVIADEPTTALDVVVQAQILHLLTQLVTQRGIGLMMISHDLSVLATGCRRLAVMQQGHLVEHGPTRELLTAPRHEHTAQLTGAFPTIGAERSRYVDDTAAASPASAPTGEQHTDTADGAPVLAAENVSVTYGDHGQQVQAVRAVTLRLHRNEILALVGQSGSGKTTLARTLLGLQQPTAGRVLAGGDELPQTTRALRAYRGTVQLILQDPTGALNPRHTVYEAVAEGLRIHGHTEDEHARVVEALDAAELRPAEQYLTRLPHELSGGQRQRVVIAGALALQPQVLVADEPVASLDATVRGEILALLLRLRTRWGLSTLVITHDLGLAWTIADRVAVMRRGELVETGPVRQVLLQPHHDYTRSLLAAVPRLHEA